MCDSAHISAISNRRLTHTLDKKAIVVQKWLPSPKDDRHPKNDCHPEQSEGPAFVPAVAFVLVFAFAFALASSFVVKFAHGEHKN
jgi:hypothetical protein